MVAGYKGYSFTEVTNHICAINGNKWLKFDNEGVLSLSLDGGSTYPITLDLTGVCDIIARAIFYANGNIGWSNHTQCFYSTDNLATYHEATVLEVDGSAYVPGTYDQFKPLGYTPELIINGVQMDIWGNYSLDDSKIRAWYSIDSGVTIKACYRNYQIGPSVPTIPGLYFRHIHGMSYNPADDSYWMEFGDAASGWNKGSYNWGTDTWTWENIFNEDGSGYHKTTGIQFHGDYIYWASDSTTSGNHGIWKAPYLDIGVTTDNYTQIRALVSTTIGLFGENGVMITCLYSSTTIHLSLDYGVTWESHNLAVGCPPVGLGSLFYAVSGGDNKGYYRADVQEDPGGTIGGNPEGETGYDSARGITLLIQAYSNKAL